MKKTILIIGLLLSFSISSQTENNTKKAVFKDLKVGLVLSGGGAKGLAHVGAIKAIEEAGIRIDYIGGTSAGAMVGALYASGYNAKELDSILKSYDYKALIQDSYPRALYSFYQKENSEKYALSLPIKNKSIGLPVALSKGQNMLNELSILTKHVHGIKDFSKLPIPFFCIATDIENGDEVVLENGFLPQAIRASGAFPSVFAPVQIKGRALLDGGIVNNFPIDIMQQKDVDVIIGVDVQGKLENSDLLDSAPKIIMQIVSFQMYDDKQDKRERTDVYIKPNMTKYSVISFDKMHEIIQAGETAARKEMEYLVGIASQQIKKPLKIRTEIKKFKNKYLTIKKIKINGNTHYTRNYVLSKLKQNRNKKDSITYKEFNTNINALASTQNFKSIDYVIKPADGGSIIELNLKENDVSNFVQIGVHYDDLYKTGVILNYTGKHIITDNDIISTDFVLGDNLRYNLNYLVDNGFHWRFGISHRYNSFKKNMYFNTEEDELPLTLINSIPIKYNDFTTQLYFQTKFKEKFAFNGGLEHKYLNISTEVLNNNKNEKIHLDKSNYYDAFAEITLDTRDAKYFTKNGWYFKAKYNTYLKSSDYNDNFTPFSQILTNLEYNKTYFSKVTTQIGIDAGITIGSTDNSFGFYLGGYNKNYINTFLPFYGYDTADLDDANFIKTAATINYELFSKNYLSVTANAAILNNAFIFDGTVLDEIKSGLAIGYGINSILGPIEIKYAMTPDNDKHYWYFNIGFWF